MKPGDLLEVEVPGIGTLANRVAAEVPLNASSEALSTSGSTTSARPSYEGHPA